MGGVGGVASGNSFPGPPDERTGAPRPGGGSEGTCASLFCHSSFPLDSGPGLLRLELPSHYRPAAVYEIAIAVEQPGQQRWGFEVTALDEQLLRAGGFSELDALVQVSESYGREYAKHTREGTAEGTADGFEWRFEWRAPEEDVGPVRFFATANAANASTTASGDYIYSEVAVVPEPSGGGLVATALAALSLLARLRLSPRVRLSPRGRGRARGPC